MRRGFAVLVVVALSASSMLADDGIALSIHKGPAPGAATLSWTGSIPNFDLFRSPSRTMVTDAAHLVLVTGTRQQSDSVLPAVGSVLFYVVTSVGPCAPQNPAPVCTAAERCYPTEDHLTSCAGPVGSGTQCSACSSDAQCSPISLCVPGPSFGRCQKWCRIGFSTDCTFGTVCLPFATPVYAGSQQYGACACS